MNLSQYPMGPRRKKRAKILGLITIISGLTGWLFGWIDNTYFTYMRGGYAFFVNSPTESAIRTITVTSLLIFVCTLIPFAATVTKYSWAHGRGAGGSDEDHERWLREVWGK